MKIQVGGGWRGSARFRGSYEGMIINRNTLVQGHQTVFVKEPEALLWDHL